MERKVKKPVEIGDVIELDIISKGKNNDGVGYYGETNFVIFIEKGVKGQKARVKINHVAKDCAFGELVEVIE